MSEVKFTTGNFDLVIKGTLKPDQQEKANDAAIRWITQRDVASGVYVELAGVKNSKGNLALPEGFQRDSIAFNEDNANAMQAAAESKLAKYLDNVEVTVSEHVAGESAAPRAMATQMWEKAKANPAVLAGLGLDANASDEKGIEACHTFLSSLRKPKSK